MSFCNEDLSLFNQEKNRFGFNWTQFNETYTPPHSFGPLYAAFQHKDSNKLNGLPYEGKYNTYMGGGYVFELRGKLSFIKGNLSLLQQMDWIDRQTRAVFVEFSVFNPNINLFMVSTLLVEFLPAGNLVKSYRFDPLNLFNEIGSEGAGFSSFKMFCNVAYILFVIYFMVKEIRSMIKLGPRLYFSQFWSYIEWMIILFSWTSLAIFLYRLYAAHQVMDFFSKTAGYAYIKLQRINYWNQALGSLLGLCACFGTIKFLKLLRFNKKLSYLSSTLRHCLKEMVGFTVVFSIIWLSFVQIMYLILNEKMANYSTFVKAMETTFAIMLGKFDVNPLLMADKVFGPVLFAFYNLMIVLISLNIFISLITDAFVQVRKDSDKLSNEFEVVEYLTARIRRYFGKNGVVDESSLKKPEQYRDNVNLFPNKVQVLLRTLDSVNI